MAAFNVGGQRTATKKTLKRLKSEPPSPKRDALIRQLEADLAALNCGQTMIIEL
jgi:hypothetical protein